ncbi:CMRF35-like molecule 1 isoform X3 [Lates calcarifer]|uniref:CMRF35-like molecule 1 isoform X3 n=1 Tax=Lates calcarifer TaxID=8187 RepID=A0AAJ7PPQ1_LATCA|nr:CMRF35-like molecule 1 isoform X3 [Lates calcarifer]
MNPLSSMELIFLFLVFLAVGLRGAEAMSLKGEKRGQISITCSHSNAYSNVKYFCRGACYDEDVLISTREKKDHTQRKYSIRDEGNTFYVTIFDLKKDDEGTYWCGIDRVGIDTYNKVVLTVSESTDDGLQRLNSEKLVYIGAGLGVVVLALAIVLLIFFRHRKRDISASSANKDEDTEGRTDSIVISSAVRRQDTSGGVTDPSKTQNQSDGLFYSSVSFSKRTDSSPVTADHAEVTYSTIAHTSTDKSSVYCNV